MKQKIINAIIVIAIVAVAIKLGIWICIQMGLIKI